jgi:hypothetical protein
VRGTVLASFGRTPLELSGIFRKNRVFSPLVPAANPAGWIAAFEGA